MPDNGYYSWNASVPISNGSADSTVNWVENQAPSTVNGSARSMMSRFAQYLQEQGFPTAGGTANALTLTPLNVLVSYASNMFYSFQAASSNTAAATLNISALGGKAIRKIVGGTDVALDAGDIVAARRYVVVYDSTANAAAGAFILVSGQFGNAAFYSDDAGAAAGPVVDLYRNSASPAVNDILGNITFNGRDSAANKQEYASIEAVIADPVSGSEDSTLNFYVEVAGTRTLGMSLTGANVPFGVVRVQTFTGSGTYTPNANMKYCQIVCQGAGGGGAGTDNSPATTSYQGGSGGSGSLSIAIASKATIGASQTVTIGAAGTGGASGNNVGGAGGDTSVGSICIGKGASGGPLHAYRQGGAGGVAGTGDITTTGTYGGNGVEASGIYNPTNGASSYFGGGGNSNFAGVGGVGTRGAGGAGGHSYNAGGASAGGAGGAGYVYIMEYCSA
jgi:hypothetical protein